MTSTTRLLGTVSGLALLAFAALPACNADQEPESEAGDAVSIGDEEPSAEPAGVWDECCFVNCAGDGGEYWYNLGRIAPYYCSTAGYNYCAARGWGVRDTKRGYCY
jgi:hypothetical protein